MLIGRMEVHHGTHQDTSAARSLRLLARRRRPLLRFFFNGSPGSQRHGPCERRFGATAPRPRLQPVAAGCPAMVVVAEASAGRPRRGDQYAGSAARCPAIGGRRPLRYHIEKVNLLQPRIPDTKMSRQIQPSPGGAGEGPFLACLPTSGAPQRIFRKTVVRWQYSAGRPLRMRAAKCVFRKDLYLRLLPPR